MKGPASHRVGKKGERIAARYLRRHGCRILARNLHCGRNELDIVAREGHRILFVEVKTRAFESADAEEISRPALAVNRAKRVRTLAAARDYLRAHPGAGAPRFDVIEVYLDRSRHLRPFRVHHIPGAFGAGGRVL